MWDAATGQPLGEPLQGHTLTVFSVSFSSDGTRIMSGSQDTTVRLWDATTGQPLGEPLQGHTGAILSVSFSPDGTRIASGSADNTIRLWDAAFGQTCHDNTETNSFSFPSHTSCTTPRARQHPIMSPITWNHGFISFSSDFKSERALCNPADLIEGISHHHSNSTPLSLQADGWVMGPNRRLLFWIPPASQHALCTPWNLWVIPRGAELDLSRMAHGTRWSSCRNAPTSR
ncbi:WD40-repeat-containing domain protein [Suillus discolor]|uniref:WD40-repeat-containing domain protein n=1 Tax=Suillus discolor TaxID=1912936 RepID=A0A9P7JTI2_9AGAM|nr:WD40-repeat-containing domain protein [Suillus discolor]KAG2106974.1 WD40-repeat-containing domain protein [Suillus discolor]